MPCRSAPALGPQTTRPTSPAPSSWMASRRRRVRRPRRGRQFFGLEAPSARRRKRTLSSARPRNDGAKPPRLRKPARGAQLASQPERSQRSTAQGGGIGCPPLKPGESVADIVADHPAERNSPFARSKKSGRSRRMIQPIPEARNDLYAAMDSDAQEFVSAHE